MSQSKRPDNWYSMSYDQQREWERADRRHRDELDDADRRERDARDEADNARQRLDRARREHRAYAADLSEENERIAEELHATRGQRDALLAVAVDAENWFDNHGAPDDDGAMQLLAMFRAAIGKAKGAA